MSAPPPRGEQASRIAPACPGLPRPSAGGLETRVQPARSWTYWGPGRAGRAGRSEPGQVHLEWAPPRRTGFIVTSPSPSSPSPEPRMPCYIPRPPRPPRAGRGGAGRSRTALVTSRGPGLAPAGPSCSGRPGVGVGHAGQVSRPLTKRRICTAFSCEQLRGSVKLESWTGRRLAASPRRARRAGQPHDEAHR